MPTVEKPCFLLPHGYQRSAVYICLPVNQDRAKKSTVLESLMEFDGVVDMPAGVSLDVFETWSEMLSAAPDDLSFVQLVSTLQISDRLGAHNTDSLAKALATEFTGTLVRSRDIVSSMLLLSQNVLRLVIRHLPKSALNRLSEWPLPLQQALADGWVTPAHGEETARFEVPSDLQPARCKHYFDLLAQTDPSLQQLRALSVLPSLLGFGDRETANSLCSALQHHPSLVHLDVRAMSWLPATVTSSAPTPATIVYQALPQLSCLTSLALGAPVLPDDAPTAVSHAISEGLHAMATAISALQHLASFRLYSHGYHSSYIMALSDTGPRRPAKRGRFFSHLGPLPHSICMRSTPTPPSLDPVISALSAAPALTSLSFFAPNKHMQQLPPCSGIHGPFTSLKKLHVSFLRDGIPRRQPIATSRHHARAHHSRAIDSFADASPFHSCSILNLQPLPALFELRIEHWSTDPEDHDLTMLGHVLASLHLQPVLRIGVLSSGPKNSKGGATGVSFRVEQRTGLSLWWRLGLSLSSVVPDLHPFTGPLAHLDGVTCLSIEVRADLKLPESIDSSETSRFDLGTGLRQLTAFTGLQKLECSNLFNDVATQKAHRRRIPANGAEVVSGEYALCKEILAAPLAAYFPGITNLHLSANQNPIPFDLLCREVPKLMGLQELSVELIDISDTEKFLSCFGSGSLTGLVRLSVVARPMTASILKALGSAAWGMPKLDYVLFESYDVQATDDWYTGLVDLPARGAYAIFCECKECLDQSGVQSVTQRLREKGATVVNIENSAAIIEFYADDDSAVDKP